ncbi:MAG TPA: extracellular matrix/biofilm biosynthesis regulator RemA family protein [Bacillota bacterium]|nr:extracellular matrix/biofilm biosynthesis regulator RemA family protein [Bacillota bacterium]
MFIHIGNDNVIRSREIIAIVEYEVITSSSIMEEMIEQGRKRKTVLGPMDDAKSVVITNPMIYFSSLSVYTLKKRSSISAMLSKAKEYTNQIEE